MKHRDYALLALALATATGCYKRSELYPTTAQRPAAAGPVITDTIRFVTSAQRAAGAEAAAPQESSANAADAGAGTATGAAANNVAGAPDPAAAVAASAEARPAGAYYVSTSAPVALPDVPREFRGVWVATVGNLDWPSRRSLTTEQQQAELLGILDAAHANGLNAVIFQVRTMGDAFYDSPYEPWSDYLTGASDRAPDPYWDPLQFAIEQAHARGLELHAWFNPFRAGFTAKQTPLAERHVSKRRPDLVRRYGTHYWMDPGEPDARKLALDVITDVVRRYDVDAVHIDDYFYPYLERDARGRLISFPDDASWREHGIATGLSRADWRRSNVDTFVEQLYTAVRAEKSHVRVGISPFGIWRPGYPATVRGLDAFTELYADSRKWLQNGWADYYAPQLYWRTYAPQQDYSTLLQWWSEQNPYGRHIWAGNIPNSVTGGTRGWPATEIVEQVRLTRSSGGSTGNVHFSARSLVQDAGGVFASLRADAYGTPALVPATPWLVATPPAAPVVTATPDAGLHATSLSLRALGDRPGSWIVRARWGDEWHTLLLPGTATGAHVDWRAGRAPDLIAVSVVGRAGVEGAISAVSLIGSND